MKKVEKTLAPSSRLTTLAAATVRTLRIESGMIGCFTRFSMKRNAAPRKTATSSRTIVWMSPQPTSGALAMA